jgi:outer membrane protein assembly factor BamB
MKETKGDIGSQAVPAGEMLADFIARMKAPGLDRPQKNPRRLGWKAVVTIGLLSGLVIGLASYFGVYGIFYADYQTVLVPEDNSRQPDTKVSGLLRFRGNSTHTYYGEGPVPKRARFLWRFPKRPMCSRSIVNRKAKIWCGTGWTGQPVVWERPEGDTELIFGAYDRKVHFLDVATGKRTRPDFRTGDLIKGSVTLDPDGYPLLYFGSRDNKFRIVALDRKKPTNLWHLNANAVAGIWNNDWDSSPLIQDDILYEGGENGYLFAFQLNRAYDERGLVQISPTPLLVYQGWNDDLLEKIGDRNVSIENSVAIYEDRLYFANSAGRIVGLDISQIGNGKGPVVFDYWVGDDVDASIVIDQDGFLYVAVELERYLPRSDELGQLLKLDPYNLDNTLVWSLDIPPSLDDHKSGIWSTPALAEQVLYVTTHSGLLAAVDRQNGNILFSDRLGSHAWSSPVVVDDSLVVATCKGEIRHYSIEDQTNPRLLWITILPTGACIESTPAVWKGKIYVGARDGYMYAFGQR